MNTNVEQIRNDKLAWEAVIVATQGAIACFEINLAPIKSRVALELKDAVVSSLTRSLQSARGALETTNRILELAESLEKLTGEEAE